MWWTLVLRERRKGWINSGPIYQEELKKLETSSFPETRTADRAGRRCGTESMNARESRGAMNLTRRMKEEGAQASKAAKTLKERRIRRRSSCRGEGGRHRYARFTPRDLHFRSRHQILFIQNRLPSCFSRKDRVSNEVTARRAKFPTKLPRLFFSSP